MAAEPTITIAVIAAVQLLAMALVTGWIADRHARRDAELKGLEKAEDYARQDLVAARVAAAAKQAADAAALLLKAQKDTIARTEEVARLAAETDKRITNKLDQTIEQGKKIHILVNSDMTAARTAERDSAVLLLIALKRLSGSEANEAELEEINKVEKRIEELNQILADRLAAQHRVDDEERLRIADKLKG